MTRDRILARDPRVLRSLQYFEAVARIGSIKGAAQENNVTASAVSHQLRELRNYLGEEIVVRCGRGVRLTETGEQIYQQVSRLFEDLDRILARTVGEEKALVRLAVCSSFGPAWLAKRLPDFQERNPSIDVELRMFSQDPLQTEAVADVVVTADESGAGFQSVTLFEEMLVPVIGPQTPLDKEGMPLQLITTDIEPQYFADDWKEFCSTTGLDYLGSAGGHIVRSTHYMLAMALARADVGAALVPDFLAADVVRRGDLRLLTTEKLPAGRVYKACYKISRARDPAVKTLVSWMKAQAKQGDLPPLRLPADQGSRLSKHFN